MKPNRYIDINSAEWLAFEDRLSEGDCFAMSIKMYLKLMGILEENNTNSELEIPDGNLIQVRPVVCLEVNNNKDERWGFKKDATIEIEANRVKWMWIKTVSKNPFA